MIVTGAAAGLGAAVVRAVEAAGGRAIGLDRDADASPVSLRVDVTDRAAVEEAVEEAARRLGGIDAVVTAAGTDACGRLEDVDAATWERVIAVNLLGTAAVVRSALPHLRASHGRVVTIASTLGLKGVSDATAYCASKFGVIGFTRALAAELRGEVGTTLVVPGGMRTNFFDERPEQYRPADDSRLNSPDTVAQAIVMALCQPPEAQLRELVICHESEDSWP